ncbi:MAG: polyprenyl diphosphate synthase [Candidatus Heimdallarchaeota archaeon]|nr:polyprenyl diphosphate synthase [Candidatus Heimdallarchaeota archaeon]MDH5645505.1 polyprenyl diphosphate synthase [Candidatus Heimdallarchaeota archaeon]
MSLGRFLLGPIYSIYEKTLYRQIPKNNSDLPKHIGIILDGNRRYSKSYKIPFQKGYQLGADKLEEVLEWLWDLNVKVVSVWVFSTENFSRDTDQISVIMKMAEEKTVRIRESKKVHNRGVQIRYSGDRTLLPNSLNQQINKTEEETEQYNNHILNICMAYGGRAELTDAIKKITKNVVEGNLTIDQIDEDLVTEHLYTNGLPDPDLIIRTSGSVRLSGFLMWQSIYSELYFADVLWPSFRKIDLYRAIRDYLGRKRNFGK